MATDGYRWTGWEIRKAEGPTFVNFTKTPEDLKRECKSVKEESSVLLPSAARAFSTGQELEETAAGNRTKLKGEKTSDAWQRRPLLAPLNFLDLHFLATQRKIG